MTIDQRTVKTMTSQLKMNSLLLTIAGVGATLLAGPASYAQLPQNEGWSISAGFGEIFSPTYLGDDSYQLSVLPYTEGLSH